MAVPKQKTSKAKKRSRRSHDGLSVPARSVCPQCQEPKVPHRICGNCGTYKGREILKTDEE